MKKIKACLINTKCPNLELGTGAHLSIKPMAIGTFNSNWTWNLDSGLSKSNINPSDLKLCQRHSLLSGVAPPLPGSPHQQVPALQDRLH